MAKTTKSSSSKAYFRDSVADFKTIVADIRRREFAPIYLLMGPEPYFIDKLSDMLSDTILSETERGFDQVVVYGLESTGSDVSNLARRSPMIGKYNVVIVREAQKLRDIEVLHHYAQKPAPQTILVICYKEKTLDKRGTLYKSIKERGRVFESITARDDEFTPWLTEYVKSKGFTMSEKALAMMVEHLGADISKALLEIEKLKISIPEGTTTITPDHIEEYIGVSKDFNNFELTKAISERKINRALTIVEYFANDPKDNPVVVTMSMLFTHFQRIFLLNYTRWLAKKNGTALPSDFELAKMLKLPNPYFLSEYKVAANNYPNSKVYAILGYLREYDAKSKGMGTGDLTHGELLKELLLKIML